MSLSHLNDDAPKPGTISRRKMLRAAGAQVVQDPASTNLANGSRQWKVTEMFDFQFREHASTPRLDRAEIPGHEAAVEQGAQAIQV